MRYLHGKRHEHGECVCCVAMDDSHIIYSNGKLQVQQFILEAANLCSTMVRTFVFANAKYSMTPYDCTMEWHIHTGQV